MILEAEPLCTKDVFKFTTAAAKINRTEIPIRLANRFIVQDPPNTFFLENALKKSYWIFAQICFTIWKYNPSG